MDKPKDASQRFVADSIGLKRTVAMSAVAGKLRDCLDELDRLQVWRVGAHVSQALSELESEISSSL